MAPTNRHADTQQVRRCAWPGDNTLLCDYHDREWGVPEYDSRALWEKLMPGPVNTNEIAAPRRGLFFRKTRRRERGV